MPELPEVETIARALRSGGRDHPSVSGRVVHSAQVLWERSVAEPDVEEFLARLPGQRIDEIGRRGKFLRLRLSTDTLLIHLRMSGDLRVESGGAETAVHDRILFGFTDGWRLVFNDPRKFGRVWLTSDPSTVLGSLGSEPFDEAFTAHVLYEGLQKRKRQLKPLLLDQTFIAGLGNIYTDEALHLAELHPLQSSERVSETQAEKLWGAIRSVLEEGIRRNGASIDWVYRGGSYQNHFRVYGRTGDPCPVCGTPVEHLLVGQRSTHYCPVCQAQL